jgi:hypothetical protein
VLRAKSWILLLPVLLLTVLLTGCGEKGYPTAATVNEAIASVGYLQILDSSEEELWSGTAWVCGENLVATARHCVIDDSGNEDVQSGNIIFNYGSTAEDVRPIAGVLAMDDVADIAVLRVDTTDLKAIAVGTEEGLMAGDAISIISNPKGSSATANFLSTATVGKITTMALLTAEEGGELNCTEIQFSGGDGVKSGSSGGVVLKGTQAVGIERASYTATEIDVASPVSYLQTLLASISEETEAVSLEEINNSQPYYISESAADDYWAYGEQYTESTGTIEAVRYAHLEDEEWLYSSFTIDPDEGRMPNTPHVYYEDEENYSLHEDYVEGYYLSYMIDDDGDPMIAYRPEDGYAGYRGLLGTTGTEADWYAFLYYYDDNLDEQGYSIYTSHRDDDSRSVYFETYLDDMQQGAEIHVNEDWFYLNLYEDDERLDSYVAINIKTGSGTYQSFDTDESAPLDFEELGITYNTAGKTIKLGMPDVNNLLLTWESETKYTLTDDFRKVSADGDNWSFAVTSKNPSKPYVSMDITKGEAGLEAAFTAADSKFDSTAAVNLTDYSMRLTDGVNIASISKDSRQVTNGTKTATYYPEDNELKIDDGQHIAWLGKSYSPIVVAKAAATE